MIKHQQFKRADRVGEEIRKALAQMVIEGVIKDPRVGMVSFTDVRVTDDLRNCKVYFSMIGSDEERNEAMRAMIRAVGFIRSELARRINLRYVPDIRFYFDTSLERGERINELLKEAQKLPPPTDEEEPND